MCAMVRVLFQGES